MSDLAVSQIEKHFITNEIYKRSKRYFDVIRLKSIENQGQKFRRKPVNPQHQQIQKKIQVCFNSSSDFYSKKRQDEIQRSKKKHCSIDTQDNKDQTQTNYSVMTKNDILMNKKGFDMSKSLPREFYENLKNQEMNSPEDFDNYFFSDFQKGQKGKSIDFNKIIGRKDTISKTKMVSNVSEELHRDNDNVESNKRKLQNSDLSHDLSKAYQKFYFDQSRFKCLIDVQKQKKAEHRRSLRDALKPSEPKQISLDRIEKGLQFTRKLPAASSLMFYHGKGQQEPAQMHLRTLKKNQNYWIQQIKIMKKQDFETVKRRQEMVQKRLRQIKARRQVIDQRGQICDAKYFLRNKYQ